MNLEMTDDQETISEKEKTDEKAHDDKINIKKCLKWK